jgi:hypothetical protein
MPQKTVIAHNVTGSPATIVGLGVTIAGGATYPLSDYFRLDELQECASLTTLINAATLVLNDGTADLSLAGSLNWITPSISDKPVDAELDNASSVPATGVLVRWGAGSTLNGVTIDLSQAVHEDLDSLAHNIAETCYEEITRDAQGRASNYIVWATSAKLIKVRSTDITRDAQGRVLTVVDKHFNAAGALITGQTITSTITRDASKRFASSNTVQT